MNHCLNFRKISVVIVKMGLNLIGNHYSKKKMYLESESAISRVSPSIYPPTSPNLSLHPDDNDDDTFLSSWL